MATDPAPLRRSDSGETLIEVLVAVTILGIAAVAILGGLVTSIQSSSMHRNQATGGAYVRSFAEAIQTSVDNAGLKPCATAASAYSAVSVPDLPAGYTPSVSAVQSWNGSTWGSCTPDGVQRLDLKVTTTGDSVHQAAETLTVILRKPCSGSATTAGDNPCS
jgi:type II secretory pathway pseudopilin PulG